MEKRRLLALAAAMAALNGPAPASPTADSSSAAGSSDAPVSQSIARQSRDDAWWTGPLLAASAGTLSPGHFLIEPYVFDVMPQGHYDSTGKRQSGPHANNFGSQSYVLYGLSDRVSVGLIPRFAYNDPGTGTGSSHPAFGDLTLQAQYGLSRFREGTWIPSTAFVLQETIPTGRYDRLGDRPADGVGSGAWSTTLGLYSQYLFWLPNGRILRTRLDLSYSISGSAAVRDVSVYGTAEGFRGRARPGNVTLIDAAGEYSVTRNWVLALDALYEHDGNTRVHGLYDTTAVAPFARALEFNSGPGHSWSLAPAIEYNFNSRVGLIAGAKLTVAGRNSTALVIPVAALNIVI
jgi:hypothetical protein